MIEARRYTSADRADWNRWVEQSREGTFLFRREFMDYHSDRFTDASLIFTKSGRWVACLPACAFEEQRLIVSHGGLTYGSLLTSRGITARETLEVLQAMARHYHSEDYERWTVKPTPYIYHRQPSEEMLYWLFRAQARLTARTLSSVVDYTLPITLTALRRRMRNKAQRSALQVLHDASRWEDFWHILEEVLQKHDATPTHSLSEIRLLAERFPEEISLHCVVRGEKIVAGCVLFHTPQVTHAQYIAADESGRRLGALDLLFTTLIEEGIKRYAAASLSSPRYFDFGISTEKGGRMLNEGLVHQKEGFGAQALCYDAYTMSLQHILDIS